MTVQEYEKKKQMFREEYKTATEQRRKIILMQVGLLDMAMEKKQEKKK